jgi:hypothetical protein
VGLTTVNPRTKPAPPIIFEPTRWAIAKRHEVVERCSTARQQDHSEIYIAR